MLFNELYIFFTNNTFWSRSSFHHGNLVNFQRNPFGILTRILIRAQPDVVNSTFGTVIAIAQTTTVLNSSNFIRTGVTYYSNTAGLISYDGGASYAYISGPDPAPGAFLSKLSKAMVKSLYANATFSSRVYCKSIQA